MLNKFTLSFFSICALAYCANANNVGKLNLDEVVVTASGFESSLKDETRNVYVIKSSEIDKKGYRSIKEVLEKIPGVSFFGNMTGTGFSESIDMRGQGNKANTAVKVMINGVAINMLDTSHTVAPFEMISIDDVERIEVLPGGGSVLYGSGTRGGVINIITKNSPRAFYGSLESKFGSYNYRDFSLNLGGNATQNLFLKFNSKIFSTNGYQHDEKNRGYYLSGALNYQISEMQNLEILPSIYREKTHSAKSLTLKELTQNRRQNPSGETTKIDLTKFDIITKYQIFLDNLELNLKPYYQLIKLENKPERSLFRDEKIGVNFSSKLTYHSGELILGYEMLKNKGKRQSIIDMNIPKMGQYHHGTFIDIGKLTNSLYFMQKHEFDPQFDLSVGARLEHAVYDIDRKIDMSIGGRKIPQQGIEDKTTQNNFAFEITPNFKYSDTGNIYTKFERGYISPSPVQLTDKIKVGRSGVYVLNGVKSETFNTYEIGLKDEISNEISLASSVFYTDTTKEILQKFGPGGHGQEWKFFNIDKTRRVGFEIGLKERIFDMLDFTQSYSFVDAKIKSGKNNGKEVPFVSKHKFVFGVTYEPVRDLAIFADLKYHSAQRDIKDEKNIKSRTITDVGVNYKFANGLSLGAGVKNLFNKKYFDYADVENDLYTPANERNFYARIKYEF